MPENLDVAKVGCRTVVSQHIAWFEAVLHPPFALIVLNLFPFAEEYQRNVEITP